MLNVYLKSVNVAIKVLLVLLSIIYLSACGGGSGSNSTQALRSEVEIYNSALAAYNTADYSSAVTQFNSLINNYPSSTLIADSYYNRGKSYFYLQDYPSALADFEIILILH